MTVMLIQFLVGGRYMYSKLVEEVWFSKIAPSVLN